MAQTVRTIRNAIDHRLRCVFMPLTVLGQGRNLVKIWFTANRVGTYVPFERVTSVTRVSSLFVEGR